MLRWYSVASRLWSRIVFDHSLDLSLVRDTVLLEQIVCLGLRW